MISNLWERFRRWRRRAERNRRLNRLRYASEILTQGEILAALKGWEGIGTGTEYIQPESAGKIEVVQTGYVYIFQAANILRLEEIEREEQRIKKALAAGVLVTDARARLVDVKPRLEARVKQW